MSTVQETVSMLHQLIYNLGGAMIALVEENTYELKKYQSNATMEINYTAMTRKEKSFKEQIYCVCLMRLRENIFLSNFESSFGLAIFIVISKEFNKLPSTSFAHSVRIEKVPVKCNNGD
jgi:hypothetical protein